MRMDWTTIVLIVVILVGVSYLVVKRRRKT